MGSSSVTEIVGLVNNNKVIIPPVQPVKIKPVGCTATAGQVCVKQYVIIQAISGDRIINIVVLIGVPVLRQLFRAEDKYRLVPVLIIFDNGKSGKGFAQPHAVSQDTAVVLLQFIDNGENSVPLEIIKHTPDFALLEASCFIG